MILAPIVTSIKIAICATIITFIISLIAAHRLRFAANAWAHHIETLVSLPMVLPPSIIGYMLLIALGKQGFIGKLLYEHFGVTLLFSWGAAVLAAVIVTLPIMFQSIKSAFHGIDPRIENAARTMGASERRVFFTVTLPLALPHILSGVVLTFARALGEFGATLMVAGNIPGKTQTIPLAIYFAAEAGDQQTANGLLIFVIIFSFIILSYLNKRARRQAEEQHA